MPVKTAIQVRATLKAARRKVSKAQRDDGDY
jgi:hypothetical protein